MPLNQKQIKDHYFETVAAAKAAGRPGEVCFVAENWTWYEYIVAGAAYTADDTTVLTTGNGGDTRWVGRAGKYISDAATAFANIKQAATTSATGVLYCAHGTSTFQSTTGRTITLDPVAPNTNYQVLIEQQADSGFVGEIAIKTKATNSFVVENSGSDVTTAFGWTLINV